MINASTTSSESEVQAELLQMIEKFNGVFNDLVQDVMQRVIAQQFEGESTTADFGSASSGQIPNIKLDPQSFLKQQFNFLTQQQMLWQNAVRSLVGEPQQPLVKEARGDKRFVDGDWEGNPVFSYIKQAYLLNAEYLNSLVDVMQFDDKRVEERIRFYTRQFVNSMSPSNYLFTNPEVFREMLQSEGENLARGIDNFMRDLENSPNEAFKITQVKVDAFRLGQDLASTPGSVVYKNRLIQLIQYAPMTAQTHRIPLLIIPPFINKYYILDLDKKKSLVRWLVDQGFTVFMISWVNPDHTYESVGFDEYVREGVNAALDNVVTITGEDRVNVAGYCVGGTLLGMAQSWLRARGDARINSLSFLTTLFDFSEPGEVGNYISEQVYSVIEQSVRNKGYFDGRILGLGFSLLRENNLFWSFFINNYLRGKDPTPFDILYWNSDSTNIPGDAYLYYLRNMYMDNRLREPGALSVMGLPLDLTSIDTPSYFLAAMSDHIVLWNAAYRSAHCLGGAKRFVLTESGHVAGVVNPADGGKYPHWVNDKLPDSPQDWLAGASQVDGSWWRDWQAWLVQHSGTEGEPPAMASALEPAPGSYVKKRLETTVVKEDVPA
ncbi:class I poly(R)-hydroxyalkanoic acid synthase [Teredinibacter turnerae]|uniref:class I poly(R)-hydroxyalkanoic acid synthase n=1 Tax=Teredinibacter turnerae TaxID=2426 RepID=UPI0005F7D957